MDHFIHNTYASHYKTAKFLFENAKESNDGRFYNLVSCISFCAFALEAYVNHQGFIEQDKQWEKWDLQKHPSFKEKVKRLAQVLDINIDFKNDAFSIITPLFEFRDIVVHGRTEQVRKNVKNPQNNTKGAMLNLSSQIEKECTLKNAEKMLKNTKKIIEIFNNASKFKVVESRLFSLGGGSFT